MIDIFTVRLESLDEMRALRASVGDFKNMNSLYTLYRTNQYTFPTIMKFDYIANNISHQCRHEDKSLDDFIKAGKFDEWLEYSVDLDVIVSPKDYPEYYL